MKEITLVVLSESLSNTKAPLFGLLERASKVVKTKLPSASTQLNATKQTYRPNHKLTQAEIEQVVADYQAGQSTRALGKKYGVGRHTVARQLRKAGVTLRVRNKK